MGEHKGKATLFQINLNKGSTLSPSHPSRDNMQLHKAIITRTKAAEDLQVLL